MCSNLLNIMATFLCVIGLLLMSNLSNAQLSPGYFPSKQVAPLSFDQGFRTLWGPQHQKFQQGTLTVWLDRNSGYFSAAMKLQPGYTAGVITSFYLSNNEDFPGHHDEVDIEFLGTTPGKPYVLQTNIYVRGSGDGTLIGREMKFHLWFDPTKAFHNYAIFWSPSDIIFFVDDVPIRKYPRKSDATFPVRPMYLYGSIWDASSWATENGKYKANYNYQPFVGEYRNFKIVGCNSGGPCRLPKVSPSGSTKLSTQQVSSMQWAQRNYLVYDYCSDSSRDHTLTPEC
ncbi:putative xyloglucan endotransglucosylase/hydrolase protein 32 [Bienertia sinuspersici]